MTGKRCEAHCICLPATFWQEGAPPDTEPREPIRVQCAAPAGHIGFHVAVGTEVFMWAATTIPNRLPDPA